MSETPIEDLIDRTRLATGWGRVELVERLLREPMQDVRSFLIREGLSEQATDGYIALSIAERCDLVAALGTTPIEDTLLAGAGRILRQLAGDAIGGGPDGDLRHYADGATATLRYLDAQKDGSAVILSNFLATEALRTFVRSVAEREHLDGWTAQVRGHLFAIADDILQRPSWKVEAARVLAEPEHPAWGEAFAVGERVGLPLETWARDRLRRDPYDPRLWNALLANADATSATEISDLAISMLDLRRVCAKPEVPVQFGADLVAQFTLEAVLRGLRRLPGSGVEAMRLALNAPRPGTRMVALDVLFDWPALAAPGDVRAAVEACAEDPSDIVRERAQQLLKAWEPPAG